MPGTEAPGKPARRGRQDTATATLRRVRRILEETCEQDGQGSSLQETARRKAYRAGINRALDEMREMR